MSTTREKIAVMDAAHRGEKIECKSNRHVDIWSVIPNPVWNWDEYDYRVAVKPKEPVQLRQALIKHGAEGYSATRRYFETVEEVERMSGVSFVRWIGDPIEVMPA